MTKINPTELLAVSKVKPFILSVYPERSRRKVEVFILSLVEV